MEILGLRVFRTRFPALLGDSEHGGDATQRARKVHILRACIENKRVKSGPISQITSSGIDSALAGCPKRGVGQDGQLAGIEERAKLAAQRCKKVVEISQKSNLAARRFCCGLSEPSFESRFAKSGVFAGD